MPTPLPPDYFSPKYRRATNLQSPHWRFIRRVTFAITLGRDTVAVWWPATDCDHLHYRNLGHELPFRDVVGLNWRTHRLVTVLRRRGWKWLVNFVLRFGYLVWIAAWVFAGLIIYLHFHGRSGEGGGCHGCIMLPTMFVQPSGHRPCTSMRAGS